MGPCCVEGCEVTSEETYYFEFPTSRMLRRKWLEVIPIPGKLPLGTVVCSRHFSEDDYQNVRGKLRLKSKVVPSRLLEQKKATPPDIFSKPSPEESNVCDSTTGPLQSPGGDTITDDAKLVAQCGDNRIADVKLGAQCGDNRVADVKLGAQSDDNKVDDVKLGAQCDDNRVGDVKLGAQCDGNKIGDVKLGAQSNDKTVGDVKLGAQCGDNGVPLRLSTSSDSDSMDMCEVLHVEDGQRISDKIVVKSPIPDPKEDIEDMITNYHIKNKVPNIALMPEMVPVESIPLPDGDPIEIEGANDKAPIFIEISVDKDTSPNEAESQDCLMLLESVQVEVDPSTLLLAQEYENEDEKTPHKNDDPISLLTSSDEDDVIIQEPHIDTVEVSDTTDEDDMPLVKLVKKKSKKKKVQKRKSRKNKGSSKDIEKILWGVGMYDYYCVQCNFTSKNSEEYNNHFAAHSKVLQVCPICEFTSASKNVYSKHIRKHKEDKKFKCHLCDYRAKHNMSLIYHLKCHESVKRSVTKGFKCKHCGFRSDDKDTVLKHTKLCSMGIKIHSCDKCDYQTKRKSDLRRHRVRKHQELEIEFDADYVLEA